MARIRTLKPEFWQDEKLAPLPPLDRLVFLGLISQADDAGRLVDNVRLLNGLLFPCTEDDCGESLETLARLSRIVRYRSASGQQLIQITNWAEHQRVDNPSRYNLPGPTPEDLTRQPLTEPSRESRESLARVSENNSVTTIDHRPSTNDQKPPFEDEFTEFWERYPKKVGKLVALKAWQARRRAGVSAEDIMAGLKRYLAYKEATGETHLNASTFLGPNDRWAELWATPDTARRKPAESQGVERYVSW